MILGHCTGDFLTVGHHIKFVRRLPTSAFFRLSPQNQSFNLQIFSALKSDFGIPNVVSQKAKGKLTIFFEKLIFFKTENVTADEKKQTTNLSQRQTGCGTKETDSTQDLCKTRAPSKDKCIEKITSLSHWDIFSKNSKSKAHALVSNLARSRNKVI